MLRNLFVNACILVTIIFLGSQIFRDTGLGPNKKLKTQILSGIFGGILGVILMIFSITITDSVLLDLRHLAIVVCSIYAGPLSTILTGLILVLFRIIYFGVNQSSIYGVIMITIVTFGCIYISILNLERKRKWMSMFLFTLIIYTSFLAMLLLKNPQLLRHTLLIFISSSLIINHGVYYLCEHLTTSHNLLIKLKSESSKDFLTGLDNTRSFDKIFNNLKKEIEEKNENLAFLMIDIDFFKKVNDIYGHISGDAVLKQLGNLLLELCRNQDIVARLGGEEFCVLLRDASSVEVYEIAERIRRKVEENLFILPDRKKINITVSIGVAIYLNTEYNIDKLKEKADKKLYEAKHSGRNKVCI